MSIREALKRATDDEGSVRVIVELRRPSSQPAGEEALAPLRDLGLTVERVVGNKIIGSVAAKNLGALANDPSVRVVEPSRKLSLHVDGKAR
jgi:hypothetical protein